MSCVTSYLKGEDITGGDWAHLIRSRRENLFIRPILGGAFTLDFFSKTNTEASCKLSRVLLLTGLLICQSANCQRTNLVSEVALGRADLPVPTLCLRHHIVETLLERGRAAGSWRGRLDRGPVRHHRQLLKGGRLVGLGRVVDSPRTSSPIVFTFSREEASSNQTFDD